MQPHNRYWRLYVTADVDLKRYKTKHNMGRVVVQVINYSVKSMINQMDH